MEVIVGCEYSGIVALAFQEAGHNVTSCDLLPNDSPLVRSHYQGDIFDIIDNGFHLGIFFPPCTFLAKCQKFMLYKDEARLLKSKQAVAFVDALYNCSINQVCIENPVGILSTEWKKPSMIYHPYNFGSMYQKQTCLWLKNLAPLIYTYQSTGRRKMSTHTNGRMSQAEKSKIKSKFFPEVAAAMANQWG